ncbi:hypothetical protein CU666_09300 [Pseudomonas syringae pv. actinidifoliorum]|nr:hypothetical protein [Pseudomonas syringae pv. actinidifoliorum]NAT58479.1 hypothetical protein [Pseudomonas syringae pv. actinidifoliorum]
MFTCSPQFTKLVNRPLTKSRESAAPYTPNTPRVPPLAGRTKTDHPPDSTGSCAKGGSPMTGARPTCSGCAGSARQPDLRRCRAA